MHISANGLNLIKSFESCRLKAYKALSTEQYWTIGYGHYGADVKPGMVINQSRADVLLKMDIKKFEDKVNKYDSVYKFNQNEFDALVCFAYNVGSIDQLTAKGMRSRALIAEKMLEYTKSGGKIIKGLVARRAAEQKLFLNGTTGKKDELPVLKIGSKGEYVTACQTRLATLGYITRNQITGIYDSGTFDAVKAFQAEPTHTDAQNNALLVDGIVGQHTWEAFVK